MNDFLKEDIVTGSELIAQFMGIKVTRFETSKELIGLVICEDNEGNFSWSDELDWYRPYCDWNRLIEACKKWDMLYDKELGDFEDIKMYTQLSEILDNKMVCYDILPVFEQLVKNIHWYNIKRLKLCNTHN